MDSNSTDRTVIEDEFGTDTIITIFQIWELIKFLISACGLAASIFLLITMLRFNKLQTRLNRYIHHYALVHILSFIAAPILDISFHFINFDVSSKRWCALWRANSVFSNLTFLFIFLLATDWFMMAYHKNWILRTKKYERHSYWAAYILGGILYVTEVGVCAYEKYAITHLSSSILFGLLVVSLMVMQVYVYKRTIPTHALSTKYALYLANIVMGSYLPVYVMHFVELFEHHIDYMVIRWTLWTLLLIFECIAYGSPILVVALLGKMNKHFQMAYDVSFKRSLNTYGQDNLDEDENDHVETRQAANNV